MKDSELQIDRSCHVLYSKPCKKEILAKITLHYPEVEREAVWEQVQLRYAELLSKWRTDLGGKKNFHNGVGGTYDCIAIMCFYDVCRDVVTFREMEEIEENLILPSFRKLRFVDINKPFWKKLMYKAFVRAKSGCDKWHDYEMSVAPYETGKPIYYEFTSCPAAEFAKRFGFADIMPALCNVDYASMELLHAKLVRTTTCVDGCRCDYTICGDKDPYVKEHTWWIRRIENSTKLYDVIRIDHFRGFDEYYAIPAGSKNAVVGKWEKGPGMDLFDAVKEKLGKISIIAEDLGYITDSVRQLVKDSNFPNMKVLEFAFDARDSYEPCEYLPFTYYNNCVVYTGTHDNETLLGWLKHVNDYTLGYIKDYIGRDIPVGQEMVDEIIRLAHSSVADLCIIPLQDYLGLGNEARINTPSTLGDNWKWRVTKDKLTDKLADKIRKYTNVYRR